MGQHSGTGGGSTIELAPGLSVSGVVISNNWCLWSGTDIFQVIERFSISQKICYAFTPRTSSLRTSILILKCGVKVNSYGKYSTTFS